MASDAFQGGFGGHQSDYGVFVKLPSVPLWVPQQARQTLNDLMAQTIRLALHEIAGRVSDQAGAFSDTGNLAQSFGAEPATATGGMELTGARTDQVLGRVFSALPYAVVMEMGRRPGQPISRVGIDAIGLWAQRKLGMSAEEADHAKWAIAKNIIGHGIEGKRFAEEGLQQANPRVSAMFQILGDQMAAALVRPGAGQTGTA